MLGIGSGSDFQSMLSSGGSSRLPIFGGGSSETDEEPSDLQNYTNLLKKQQSAAGAGGIAGGLGSAASGIMGLIQAGKDKDAADAIQAIRPTYKYSAGISEATQNARNAFYGGQMPGMEIAKNELGNNSSVNAGRLLNSGLNQSNITAGILGLNNDTNSGLNSLAQQQASYTQNQQQALSNALNTEAQAQDQQFGYNQDEPYQQQAARKNALLASWRQGKQQGFDGLVNGAASAAQGAAMLAM
jgi:hypothetical protein